MQRTHPRSCAASRLFACVVLALFGTNAVHSQENSVPSDEAYVAALVDTGLADLAVEYLKIVSARFPPNDPRRADYDYRMAALMIDASQNFPSLAKRTELLADAKKRFETFARQYPSHPKRSESLVELAIIELQRARVLVIEAQMPSNAARADKLADEARLSFESSAKQFDEAFRILTADYKKFPLYIPGDTKEDKVIRDQKTRVFERMIDARFQAALARFYFADSFRSIELPPLASNAPEQDRNQRESLLDRWNKQYNEALAKAEKEFSRIAEEYRQSLVGQLAYAWFARCLVARGEHRRADGIFARILETDNKDLTPLFRQVAWFQLLGYATKKDYDQVIARGEDWLSDNRSVKMDLAALGIQYEVAKAYMARGMTEKSERSRQADLREANQAFEKLARTANEYQGLARREQLRLAAELGNDLTGRTYIQLTSLANARLAEIKPDTPKKEKEKPYREVIGLYTAAIAVAGPKDPAEQAIQTVLYLHIELDELYEAAIIAEDFLRREAKRAGAAQVGLLGVKALALAYDRALADSRRGVDSQPDADAKQIRHLAELLGQIWPGTRESGEGFITLGLLDLLEPRRDYAAAAATFERIPPQSPLGAVGQAYAGQTYWLWYQSLATGPKLDKENLLSLREKAAQRLDFATKALKPIRSKPLVPEDFQAHTVYAEVLFDLGQDQQALDCLLPLVDALKNKTLDAKIDSSRRLPMLLVLLQCQVRLGQLTETERTVDLITREQGQESLGNVTLVFVNLAQRLKEQIVRLEALAERDKLQQTTRAFERFLDTVTERDAGQTLQTLLFLGTNYMEIGKYQKAVDVFRRMKTRDDYAAKDNQAYAVKAELLSAQCLSRAGDHENAVKQIDQLAAIQKNKIDIMIGRAEILQAAGRFDQAVRQWKTNVDRLKSIQPRPDEFYQSLSALVGLLRTATGSDRSKRIAEALRYVKFLLGTDKSLPAQWRVTFEQYRVLLEDESNKKPS